MKKITLADLNNEQLDIVHEIVELFDISEEEALEQCLADGSISLTRASTSYLPEGYKELKLYTLNNKSNLFKANKAYKAKNKKDLFQEDTFYYDINIPRIVGDDGKKTKEFEVENITAIEVGTEPEVIITNTLYKAERRLFKGETPAENNFETIFGINMFEEGQSEMIIKNCKDDSIKGKSMFDYIQELKKKYGKEKSKIPTAEQYTFRVVVFGLVKIDGKWEKFYFISLNRFGDDNLVTEFDKKRTGVKSNYLGKLFIDGTDVNENPIFKLDVVKKLTMDDLVENDLKILIRDSVQNVSKWQKESVENARSSKSTKEDTKSDNTETEEDTISWDD